MDYVSRGQQAGNKCACFSFANTVMSVLQTHSRVFVNGLVLSNPYYLPVRQFLEILGA